MLNDSQLQESVSEVLRSQGCALIRTEQSMRKGNKTFRPDLVGYTVAEDGSLVLQVVAEIKAKPSPEAQPQLMEAARALGAPYGLLVIGERQYWFSTETSLPTDMPRFSSLAFVASESDVKEILWRCLDQMRGHLSESEVVWLLAYSLLIRAYLAEQGRLAEWASIETSERYSELAGEAHFFFHIRIEDLVLRNASQVIEELVSSLNVLVSISPVLVRAMIGVLSESGRKNVLGQYVTPEPVRNFLRELVRALGITGNKVVDLAAGYGSLTYEIRDVVEAQSFIGVEIVREVAVMAQILSILGGYNNVQILCDDSLYGESNDLQQDNVSDLTLVDGPFGPKSSRDGLEGFAVTDNGRRNRVDMVELFIEKAIRITRPDGHIVVVVPEGILFNSQSRITRDFIKETTVIEAIVSLPAHAFRPYTGIKTSALVLRRKHHPDETAEELFLANPDSLEELDEVVSEFSAWRNGGDKA